MPIINIRNFANKTGKSIGEIEELWNQAKDLAIEMGKGSNFSYITGILKQILELNEEKPIQAIGLFLQEKFLSSSISDFNTFLESITSSSFSATPEVSVKDEDKEPDDKDEKGKKKDTKVIKK